MADVIIAHQGTIDEFIGDAILAIFGAPGRAPRRRRARGAPARSPCRSRWRTSTRFNRGEGLPEVEMGIAVNTGEVVVGNIGSQTPRQVRRGGTHVNLAGRIESFTVGGQVLVSRVHAARGGRRR